MHRYLHTALVAATLLIATATPIQAASIELIEAPDGLVGGVIDRLFSERFFQNEGTPDAVQELSFRSDGRRENVTVEQSENTLDITARYQEVFSTIEQRNPITRVETTGDPDTALSGSFVFELDTSASFRFEGSLFQNLGIPFFSLNRQEEEDTPNEIIFSLFGTGFGRVGNSQGTFFSNGRLAGFDESEEFANADDQQRLEILIEAEPRIDAVEFSGGFRRGEFDISGTLTPGRYVLSVGVGEGGFGGNRGTFSSSSDAALSITASDPTLPTPVPTPSALLAGGLGLLTLATRRRRD